MPSASSGKVTIPTCRWWGSTLNHSEDDVREVVGALRVRDDLVVLGGVEHQTRVALQRRILAANFVDQRDQLAQAVGAVAVPAADLVLLGVEVLL